MIILGIDPGTAITGYGLIEKPEPNFSFKEFPKEKEQKTGCLPSLSGSKKPLEGLKTIAYGCIRTKPGKSDEERLKIIYNELCRIIKKHQPDVLAVESIFFFKNLKTAVPVSQAKGVILLCAAKKKMPVFEFTPLQVKMTVAGYGRAQKKQVQKMIQFLLGLKEMPRPDDAADALGIAICCALFIAENKKFFRISPVKNKA